MTIFNDLETAMESLVGAGLGGWLLGTVVVAAVLFPIAMSILLSRSAGNAGTMLVLIVAAFAVVFNVGVGWWDSWSLVFIAIIILFGWWMSKGSGTGGV